MSRRLLALAMVAGAGLLLVRSGAGGGVPDRLPSADAEPVGGAAPDEIGAAFAGDAALDGAIDAFASDPTDTTLDDVVGQLTAGGGAAAGGGSAPAGPPPTPPAPIVINLDPRESGSAPRAPLSDLAQNAR